MSPIVSQPSTPVDVTPRRRVAILAAALLATFLAALDGTLVTTAMPTVVRALHGLSFYSWVFSVYMLTTAVTMPLWGKLADQRGSRGLFAFGIAIFLLGSGLCGAATSMPALIAFRALQGVGAGAMSALGYTVIGVTMPPEQRARASGLIGAMWGIASVLGPPLGGLMVLALGWRFVFYVNLPLGAAALWLALRFIPKGGAALTFLPIDWLGGVLIAVGISLALIALQLAQMASPLTVACGAAALLLLVGFALVEKHATDPVLAPFLFRVRLFLIANTVMFCCSFAVLGILDWLPLLVPPGMPVALGSALIVFPSSLAWSISSFVSSRFVHRVGTRPVVLVATTVIALGITVFLLFSHANSPFWLVALTTVPVPIGLGMGPLTPGLLSAIQNGLRLDQMGMGSATQQLVEQIGGTFGVSVLQLSFIGELGIASISAGHAPGDFLLGSQTRSPLAFAGLVGALHHAFLFALAAAVLGAALAWLLPRHAR